MHRIDRFSSRRALTLIEVMVALGVLVVLVGGIFLIVQTSLKTVLMIDTAASREDEITNLTDVLRNGFRNLPAQAQMIAKPVVQGGVEEYLFIFRNAPGFLTWSPASEAENLIVLLSLRRDDENDGWRVCLKRFAPPENFSETEFDPTRILLLGRNIPWLELVGDFQQIKVRFFNAQNEQWSDIWTTPNDRPNLVEFSLISERTRDARSEAAVIWIPPVKVRLAVR